MANRARETENAGMHSSTRPSRTVCYVERVFVPLRTGELPISYVKLTRLRGNAKIEIDLLFAGIYSGFFLFCIHFLSIVYMWE